MGFLWEIRLTGLLGRLFSELVSYQIAYEIKPSYGRNKRGRAASAVRSTSAFSPPINCDLM